MIDLKRLSLTSSHQIASNPTLVPHEPGVYFVFFDSGTCLLEQCGYLEFDDTYPVSVDGYDLLYVGATMRDLRLRLMNHLTGNSRASSLRMTLGALLSEELHLEPVGDGTRTYFDFGDGERRLTDWIGAHTRVGFQACSNPFAIEKQLLKSIAAPLNITDRKRHAFSKYLMNLRGYYAGRPKCAGRLNAKG